MLSTPKRFFFALLAFFLWLIPCVGQIIKWSPRHIAPLVCGLAFAGFVIGFQIVGRVSGRWDRSLRWVLFGAAGLVALIVLLVFPKIHAGKFGSGTDRADAYLVGLHAIFHRSYPYYFNTPQGNPLTPMPGALMLALPFYLLGNISLENIFWVFAFAWFLTRFYRSASAYLLFFGAYILCSTVAMQDLITGGDYLINTLYVAISMYGVVLVYQKPTGRGMRILAVIFYAITLCSRPIFVLATLPVISAFILQKDGKRSLAAFLTLNILVALIIVGPFYFYDPSHFTPLQTPASYLRWAPPALHVKILLSCATLFVAAASFFRRLEVISIFGWVALAFAAMFIPYCFMVAVVQGWTVPIFLHQWTYSLPVTIFGGLWLIRQAESRTNRNEVAR